MIPAALLACALHVHPATMEAVVQVESGGRQFAINVNRWRGPQPRPASAEEAAVIANRFISAGYSVDLGYAQINNRNLAALGYTVEQMFADPCANLAAGGAILASAYSRGVQQFGEGQRALLAALSAYNTGSLTAGWANGYVARYLGGRQVPALEGGQRVAAAAVSRPAALMPYAADTSVYIREASNVRVE